MKLTITGDGSERVTRYRIAYLLLGALGTVALISLPWDWLGAALLVYGGAAWGMLVWAWRVRGCLEIVNRDSVIDRAVHTPWLGTLAQGAVFAAWIVRLIVHYFL
jgi:hypothetical protein